MKTHFQRVRFLTNLLDQQFSLFGYRFGLDPILGLIFGSGDIITFIIGLYYIWIGIKVKAEFYDILHMLFNIFLDMTVGFIPIVGDIFDFSFKAHLKNLHILEKYESASEGVIE